MSQFEKILLKVLLGTQDANLAFSDLCYILEYLGFTKRIHGSHHIFYKDQVEEIINIQPNASKAKAYQVKQIRNIILKYKLGGM